MKYIVFSGKLDIRSGGPSGYIANLCQGLHGIGEDKNVLIISEDNNSLISKSKRKLSTLKKILGKSNFILEKFIENKTIYARDLSIRNKLKETEFRSEDIIHVHSIMDYYMLENYKPNSKIVLTPHTPESVADEYIELVKKEYNNPNLKLTNFKRKIKQIELEAFKKCEYVIFPSKESMEIYSTFIENFYEIIRGKKVYYNMTGSHPLNFKLNRSDFRRKYNISQDAFVISYIGRHNKIKGFDILKEVAKEIYKIDPSIIFVSGGLGTIKAESPNFIEIGWTNDPGSIINSSDLFILPNRNTYFDLVLLEVLSLGKPVLASKTGGNKTIGKLTSGVQLFESENISEIISQIIYYKQNKEYLLKMGKENKNSYENNFTLEKFASRYLEILNQIDKE